MTILDFLNANKSEIIGAVTFAFVVAGGVFNYFRVRAQPARPPAAEFHIDGQATFTDMRPIKSLMVAVERLMGFGDPLPTVPGKPPPASLADLLAHVDLMAVHQMKAAMSHEATANSMTRLADLMSSHLADLAAEREERELDEQVVEKAQKLAAEMVKAMTVPRRRSPRKQPPRRKPPAE